MSILRTTGKFITRLIGVIGVVIVAVALLGPREEVDLSAQFDRAGREPYLYAACRPRARRRCDGRAKRWRLDG